MVEVVAIVIGAFGSVTKEFDGWIDCWELRGY